VLAVLADSLAQVQEDSLVVLAASLAELVASLAQVQEDSLVVRVASLAVRVASLEEVQVQEASEETLVEVEAAKLQAPRSKRLTKVLYRKFFWRAL